MKNARISSKMKAAYRIENTKDAVHVHTPSYINIEKDEKYRVELSEHCLRIRNSKVLVSLWRTNKIMHVTVV